MCQFISFFHNPFTGEIRVYDLNHHGETETYLKLDKKIWREGHYLPSGIIECRVADEDRITRAECDSRLKERFPSFVEFFNWSMGEICKNGIFSGYLDLGSLTSAAGLKLPAECGDLYLGSLTSAAGLKLPAKCGYLDLPYKIRIELGL